MNYITSLQAAEKWNISQRRVAILCAENRISGAIKAGKTWLIPSDCEKPKDGRSEETIEYCIKSEDLSVSEHLNQYCVKTELMLNPSLVEASEIFFEKKGKTLSDGINDYLQKLISVQNQNYRYSYPKGFFRLYGSNPKLDFPDNIEDLIPEKIEI